jgi:hypothetical protein
MNPDAVQNMIKSGMVHEGNVGTLFNVETAVAPASERPVRANGQPREDSKNKDELRRYGLRQAVLLQRLLDNKRELSELEALL